MTTTASKELHQLRVALVWNGTIQQEEQLRCPAAVGLGEGQLFPLPEGVTAAASIPLLEPAGGGYELGVSPLLEGSIWVGGNPRDIAELARGGVNMQLGPEDYGVITIGPVAVFFQSVRPAKAPPRKATNIDPALVASFGLVLFLFFVGAVIGALHVGEHPYEVDPRVLDPERIAQYIVSPPPPEPEGAPSTGEATDDQGPQSRERAGGEAARGAEGRVGRVSATREDTHVQGEVRDAVATRVRSLGLLGALTGGGGAGNAIAAALDAPNVSDILAGMGSAETVVGRGSGGMGLRG
ncbi:MAG: hypothetical protein H5U40_06495, partial [Polyangiaceae bacterium]|nr:hypothetical protein [Polyangiaceae bacterium]